MDAELWHELVRLAEQAEVQARRMRNLPEVAAPLAAIATELGVETIAVQLDELAVGASRLATRAQQ